MDDVYIAGNVIKVTEKAVLVDVLEVDGDSGDDYGEHWFPKSQCPDLEDAEDGEEVAFDCPFWIAEQKDLV